MAKSKNSIGLVVNAKGGTKIEQWLPGTEFYTEAVKRTKAALEYGELKLNVKVFSGKNKIRRR
jgi:hypothetical protein